MNSRLTIQDLAGLLAERTGKERSSSEQFLREFITIVSQGVFTDKIAKVKGLGTFKIVLVEKRESIHVNTGERFTIPAHYKFSFLPDKELRELVNKPFSFFETEELNEGVDFTDLDISKEVEDKEIEDESVEEILPSSVPDETEEVVESDLQTAEIVENKTEEIADESIEREPAEIKEAEEPVPEEPLETVEEPAETEQSEPETEKAAEEPTEQSKEETQQPSIATDFSETDYQFEDEESAPSHWVRVWVSVGVVALVAVASFFLYQNRSFFLGPEMPKASSLVGNSLPGSAVVSPDTVQIENTDEVIAVEEEKPDTVSTVSPEQTTEPATQTPKVLAKVKIEPGSRLTLISLEYYGSKIFWVYLYEFNKSVIKDPNNVPVGTEIQVPAPEVYGIDRYSRASVDKAAARQTEILSGNL